jgi:hypothetical protein
LARPIYTR